jgi:hypothetical protein
VDLSFSEQLLRVVFQLFEGKKKFEIFFKNIVATALKSYIKWLLQFFFFLGKFEKIGYHSNFNFECNIRHLIDY